MDPKILQKVQYNFTEKMEKKDQSIKLLLVIGYKSYRKLFQASRIMLFIILMRQVCLYTAYRTHHIYIKDHQQAD